MKYIFYIFTLSLVLQSCYSFKGISIPENIESYDIPFVEILTADAPPSINTDFQDKLILKITRESRLRFQSTEPDIIMKAAISSYVVESVGANSNNGVDANRLKISVKLNYEDTKNDENNWEKTFSQNREFASGVDLLSVQDQLIGEIFDDIVEDIFNQAFTNW